MSKPAGMNVVPVGEAFPWPWPITTEQFQNLTNPTTTQCSRQWSYKHTGEIIVLSSAALAIILLNFLKFLKAKFSLRKLLDVVAPFDLLHSTPFRLIYILIMSLWAADVVQDLYDIDLYYRSPHDPLLHAFTVYVLSPTVIILRQALIYFPVLACVDSSFPVLGHYIGLLYTLVMGSYNIFLESLVIRGCMHRGQLANKDIGVTLTSDVPILLGYLVVAGWFFFHATLETTLILFTKHKIGSNIIYYDTMARFRDHVQHLLKEKGGETVIESYRQRSLWAYTIQGLKYVLPAKATVQFPLPYLAALFMSSTVIYQLLLRLVTFEVEQAMRFNDFIRSFNITVAEWDKIFPSWASRANNIFYDLKSFSEFLLVILPFGTCVGFGLFCFFTMYQIQNVHKHLVRASKGDISFLIASEPLPSKSYMLAATMRYTAFQMAYSVIGWMLYSLMLIALLVIGLLFYYLFKDVTFAAVQIWSWFMVPLMWAAGMHYLQLFLCRYIFLVKDHGELVSLRFKSLYNVLVHFFFFFNVISGVVMSVLRVFGSLIFSMVMYLRLDWDIYMRGLEGWDYGHRTYVSYMYVEYTTNNAVLRTFVHLLLDATKGHGYSQEIASIQLVHSVNNTREDSSSGEDERKSLLIKGQSGTSSLYHRKRTSSYGTAGTSQRLSQENIKSKRACNRWYVAYTLLRNPGLQNLTASQLKKTAPFHL